MKRLIVLTILVIALVDASYQINDNEVTTKTNSPKNIHDTSSSEERRWQPIFPKSIQKFVVNMNPTKTQINSTAFINSSKKPMMLKIVPKTVRVINESYWKKSTTRQPLMKYTKFIVNPLTTFTPSKSTVTNKRHKDKDSEKFRTSLFRKMMNSPKKEDSSEEELESSTSDRNHSTNSDNVKKSKSALIHKIRSRLTKIKPVSKFPKPEKKLHKESDDSSEEKEDRREFIFVTPKQMKEKAVDVKDSDESNELTTIIAEHEVKKVGKQKRSVNVIEEENLGTTVSGFKFTGKVNSLSSDLVFRNIHT